jgi:hypothetical protein
MAAEVPFSMYPFLFPVDFLDLYAEYQNKYPHTEVLNQGRYTPRV